jgi:hypothetical protein
MVGICNKLSTKKDTFVNHVPEQGHSSITTEHNSFDNVPKLETHICAKVTAEYKGHEGKFGNKTNTNTSAYSPDIWLLYLSA